MIVGRFLTKKLNQFKLLIFQPASKISALDTFVRYFAFFARRFKLLSLSPRRIIRLLPQAHPTPPVGQETPFESADKKARYEAGLLGSCYAAVFCKTFSTFPDILTVAVAGTFNGLEAARLLTALFNRGSEACRYFCVVWIS